MFMLNSWLTPAKLAPLLISYMDLPLDIFRLLFPLQFYVLLFTTLILIQATMELPLQHWECYQIFLSVLLLTVMALLVIMQEELLKWLNQMLQFVKELMSQTQLEILLRLLVKVSLQVQLLSLVLPCMALLCIPVIILEASRKDKCLSMIQ